MLIGLSIRDVVLIDTLDLTFEGGLWALTGETGAGKSILLDSLGLAMGARADRALVRQGAPHAKVAAEFDVPLGHPVWALLKRQDLDSEGELILRRVVGMDGRSRAYINDQPVSVTTLRDVAELLLEIHGQHDDRGLLNPAAHRDLLDLFGNTQKLGAQTAAAFNHWAERRDALEELRARIDKVAGEEDYLRHVIKELEDLDPQPDEEDALAATRTRLMNAEKVLDDLEQAAQALQGDGGLEKKLNAALRNLVRASEKSPGTLDTVVTALDRALVEVSEAGYAISESMSTHRYDEQTLMQTEERLFALRAAARKHKTDVNSLAALKENFIAQLTSIETGQDDVAALARQVEEARTAYFDLASKLSAKRIKAAKTLGVVMAKELPPLKMERAQFAAHIEPVPEDKAGPGGMDRVQFMVATNPGAPMGALTQIASGGELARFILALKVCLAKKGSLATMIFDEVDRGVGGAVAHAVGERLARLAEGAQVLVVTHSPQVAARADHHLRVEKTAKSKAKTLTRVVPLDADQRQEEIARMLSAATVTDEARAAASTLLSGDVSPKKTGTTG